MTEQDSEILYTTKETFLKLVTRTPVKLLKKDKEGNKNDLPEIFKEQTQQVVINRPYEKAVNAALAAEGKTASFETQGRNWGIGAGAILEHENGTRYLQYILIDSGDVRYTDDEGKAYTKDDFQRFMSTAKKSSSQGLDEEIKVRSVKFDNILSVQRLAV
jgi:hypothetical protein